MQHHILKRFPKKSFLLAVLLHLLFLLSLTVAITFHPPKYEEKSPQLYNVPAYVYTGSITPSNPLTSAQPMQNPKPVMDEHPSHANNNSQHTEASSRAGIKHVSKTPHTIQPQKQIASQNAWGYQPSILDSSRAMIYQNEIKHAMSKSKDPEPILMIGDDRVEVNPLIKLMARSLSAHFDYPKLEGNFGIRGKVIVQITLHPEGYFSDVEILESSNNKDFDASALYAVNKAPTVVGADRFLSKPTTYVIGFIFD